MPWIWTRRKLAATWGCKPWEVDEAIEDGRADEINLELHLAEREAHWDNVRARRVRSR